MQSPDPTSDADTTDGNRRTSEQEVYTLARIGAEYTTPPVASVFRVPERLGPWRLVRMLGRGGMGEVWLAERCDGVFSKHVAVKLLRSDRGDVHERFKQERQVLAELDHPNIASLLDGGVTADGLPYLVTEYIEGEAIDRWCSIHKLDLRKRIALFLQVCDAVSYAHSQLVVHRDIKPGNILIDQTGRAHLLDFGIAKLVGTAGPDEITDESPHTPEYAAPEQVQGGVITVKTDVYALGLLLYFLLTGTKPQAQVAGQGLAQQIDAIVNQLPKLPSAVIQDWLAQHVSSQANKVSAVGTDLRAICQPRELRGDLDMIVMRAIQKSPADRFRSVGSFADDLRLYLAGKPVTSRKFGWFERSSRFVKAHWLGVSVGAVAMSALVAGLAFASFQQLRARAESEHAQQRMRETAAARSFATSMLGDLHLQGLADKSLLQQAERYANAELQGFPELEAGVMWDIATGYANLGLYADRAQLINNYFQRSHQGQDQAARAAASCAMASVKAEAGDRPAAMALLAQAERELLLADDVPWANLDCALTGARALRQIGEFTEAELRLARGLARLKQNSDAMRVHGPELLVELSNVQIQSAQYVAATNTLANLFPLLEQSSREETNVAQVARHNLGQALRYLGKFKQAKREFEKSIALQTMRRAETVSANTLCALAVVEQQLGQRTAASARLVQCKEQRLHQQQIPQMQLMSYERDAAEIALMQGDQAAFDQAMQHMQHLLVGFDPNSSTVQAVNVLQAEAALERAQYDQCASLITPLLSQAKPSAILARARVIALEMAVKQRQWAQAQSLYGQILQMENANFPNTHPLFMRAKRVISGVPGG